MQVEEIAFDEENIHNDQALDPERPLLGEGLPPLHDTAKQRQIAIYLAVLSLFTLSILSTGAAEIDIVYLLICYNLKTDAAKCFQDSHVAQIASSLVLWTTVITACGGVFVVPWCSALSDKYGRKLALYWCMIALSLSRLLTWYLVFGTEKIPHYYWLLMSAVVASLGGSVLSVIALAVSYVSDLVHDQAQRARYISFVDASVFIAIAFGPTVGSLGVRYIGVDRLYLVSFGGCILSIVLVYLFVKESLSPTMQEINKSRKPDSFAKFKMLLFNHIEDPVRRRTARLMAVCTILGSEFAVSIIGVMMLYVKTMFNWSSVETGYLVTGICIHRFIGFAFGFPYLHKKLGGILGQHPHDVDRTDVFLLRMALTLCVLGFTNMGFANSPAVYVMFVLVEATASYAAPVYKSALIKYAPEGQFGTFMASVSFVNAAGSLVLPPAMLHLYGSFVDTFPGVPFFVTGVLFTSVLLGTFLIKPKL